MTQPNQSSGARRTQQFRRLLVVILCACAFPSADAFGADGLYFPQRHNITQALVQTINAETVRIDMAVWLLTERAISVALVNRMKAGVPVRLIGDRVSLFEIDPLTREEFYWLANQGVPVRLRYNPTSFPELLHWKATIFAGQRVVTFGSGNYTPFELASVSSTNYKDEVVLFTNDAPLVNAFEAAFDRMWNDTQGAPRSRVGAPYLRSWDDACARESACSDYRTRFPNPVPMTINTARLVPDYPSPPEMAWGQGPDFNTRLVQEINRETSSVDFAVYRLTAADVTNALIAKFQSGVPVRVIIEPDQYSNRMWPEFWLVRANVDRLWAAGIPVRQRAHVGLMHMKMLLTSHVGTIASSNISDNWQRDHNYFLPAATKPVVHQAMRQHFETMWSDAAAFAPLVPLPPDAPTVVGPSPGAAGVGLIGPLVWSRTPFATSYDVYLGTSEAALNLVATVPAQLTIDPPSSYSWAPQSPLSAGTRYFWRIVARTFANQTASSAVWQFVTSAAGPRPGDLDGDQRKDLVVWRPGDGRWYIRQSAGNYQQSTAIQWGSSAQQDVPILADFDGDGRSDITVWRPASGNWFVLPSTAQYQPSAAASVQWGSGAAPYGDVPVPADYDGDGSDDIAVWRPGSGTWFVLPSSSRFNANAAWAPRAWGSGQPAYADQPVPADYDGDRKADLAVWRKTTGHWLIVPSAGGPTIAIQWGLGTAPYLDRPVVGDYDGDGRADVAVWRPGDGTWYIRTSSSNYVQGFSFQWGTGSLGDIPVAGDFDGDGRTDIAVWRPGTGYWYVRTSSTAYQGQLAFQWGSGTVNDIPLGRVIAP
jgi:hypothetical protein